MDVIPDGSNRAWRNLSTSVISGTPYCNAIDVHVAQLRRKLEAAGSPGLIETQRGVGYRLRGPDACDH